MKGERKLRDTVRAVSLELIELQNRLYKVGLVKTAHAANATLKELGWEAAEKYESGTVTVVRKGGRTGLAKRRRRP